MNHNQAFIESFNSVGQLIHEIAKSKGWWTQREQAEAILADADLGDFGHKAMLSQCIALAHSELSEGLEGLRKDLADDKCPQYPMVLVEMADCIIRLMDMAHHEGWPLAEAILAKIAVNSGRKYRHGGKAF